MSGERRFDVVIAGAGMAGTCCATALAGLGLSTALIDSGPATKWSPIDYDPRVSALNIASENILTALNAWPRIVAPRVSPFRQIDVWDADSTGQLSFSAADMGLSHLGHIVENSAVTSVLIEGLSVMRNVNLFTADRIEHVVSSDDQVCLRLASGETVAAELLVGADGAASTVRQAAGIELDEKRYDHQAIIAHVTTDKPHGETARQRFLPTGPLAALPLGDGRSSIVWSATAELYDSLVSLGDEAFAESLAHAFDGRLGRVTSVTTRQYFPLVRRHARHYIGPRIALIGDAAHTPHPLAGLGANLGLVDAAALAEIIEDAMVNGHVFSERAVLRRYERWRKGDNELALSLMDVFYHAFGARNPGIAGLRAFALNLTDRVGLLKHFFVNRAAGLAGDLPRLAQRSGA